jgi:hypothetical protein
MYKLNNDCYNFVEYKFNNYLFKNIDASYIIHLENNNRLENIKYQLSLYQPTNIVYILFNKGYKNCDKDKPKTIKDKHKIEK